MALTVGRPSASLSACRASRLLEDGTLATPCLDAAGLALEREGWGLKMIARHETAVFTESFRVFGDRELGQYLMGTVNIKTHDFLQTRK